MKHQRIRLWPVITAALCGTALVLMQPLTTAQTPTAGAESYRFSGPYVHQNLTIHLIHGGDGLDAEQILTLDEALEQGMVVVHETGNVSQLAVENVSHAKSVFIHAGDIVKGGRQDRVLTYDLFLQPKSGKVSIESFCVERGRWQGRGVEAVNTFASSSKRLNSKALKLAALSEKAQGTVWREVADMQDKLSENVGTTVRKPASTTSLQLSLESESVVRSIEGYRASLEDIIDSSEDVIGFAFAINGELNSIEMYGARALFVKLWPKLLDAAASEAVAEQTTKNLIGSSVDEEELRDFLQRAERAPVREDRKVGITEVQHRENDEAFYIESRKSRDESNWVHRGYLRK